MNKIKKIFTISLLSLMVLSFSVPMFASAMVIRVAPRATIRTFAPVNVNRYVTVNAYPGTINVQRTIVGPRGGTATINSTINFTPRYPSPCMQSYCSPQPQPCSSGCYY